MFIKINHTLRKFKTRQAENRSSIRRTEFTILQLATKILKLHQDVSCLCFCDRDISRKAQLTAGKLPGKKGPIVGCVFRQRQTLQVKMSLDL